MEEEIQSVADTSYDDEKAPLLSKRRGSGPSWLRLMVMRYRSSRKCVSSKAALLILVWNFAVSFVSALTLNPDLYFRLLNYFIVLSAYGCAAFLFCFFPLAGLLADLKYGRYKTVVASLLLMLISISVLLVIGVILLPVYLVSFLIFDVQSVVLVVVLPAIIGIVGVVFVIVLYIGVIGFWSNAVQFGMDQLLDSPGEDRTLFVHWYVWTYYVGLVIELVALYLAYHKQYDVMVTSYYNIIGYCLVAIIPLLVVTLLATTLYLAQHRRSWFLIEPGRFNPYKLVYKVTRYSYKHKTPVQRSAFTYCEDEVPAGLDLGKQKYGGHFTTEQVEDVKTFYGVLKVLFSFGVVFFLDFAANSVFPLFSLHVAPFYHWQNYSLYNETHLELSMINNGLVSPLLVVICIPLYLYLLRPFIWRYVPGILKRMGLGMGAVLLSLIITFSENILVHKKDENDSATCFFTSKGYFGHTLLISELAFLAQLVLSGLSHILIYTAAFEFICSQSPHSMKGLVVGVFYAIKGLNQVLATLFSLPFSVPSSSYFRPSCGFYYYLANIVIGLLALLVYVCVAKRYRPRERDEPSNIHRYAEEYYSRTDTTEDYHYEDDD
jgi:peptide/histidine transporter 3/4